MESSDKLGEVNTGNENSKARAATLLRLSGDESQSLCAEKAKRKKSSYFKIIIGVLLLCLLIIILVIVLTLKQHCSSQVSSCRHRCTSAQEEGSTACRCHESCLAEGTCCLDYQEVCVAPRLEWACTKFRCGEERLEGSLCSCADNCSAVGDCCTNYGSLCHWKKSWVEEPCEDMETPQCPAGFPRPPVILVSLDGFRAGYLEAYSGLLPVISKLKNCGTTTPYLRPAYPSKTFPNHYTIVTGLYPESHGIVDNKMYDVTRDANFSLKVPEKFNPKWYQGEPVWITAMRHGLRTGTFFWPGSDVAINGTYPNFYKLYNRSIPFEKRVMTIFKWLDLPEGNRPDFYTLYVEEPDSSGHRYGPMSSQVIKALLKVDGILGMLMDGLRERQLHKCVNLIVLSDHGMETASCSKAMYVSQLQDNIADFSVISGPAARVRPKNIPEEFFTFDYEGLVKNISCRVPDQPLRPYLKEHLPKRLHFANNVRIERAHLYMKSQWQAALKPGEMKYCSGGFHGSDNLFQNMQAIFMGYGPAIKSGAVVPPFENIEIYNLLCDLLGISPADNNGTHGSLNSILKRPSYSPVYPAEQSSAISCIAEGFTVTDSLGCGCPALSSAQEEELNQKLIHGSTFSAVKPLHLPFGVPRVLQKNVSFCILSHHDYISGYSHDLHMPLWMSYTLDNSTSDVQPLHPNSSDCVRVDVRLPATVSQTCLRYKTDPSVTFALLHPPNLGQKNTEFDSLLTSNMVPMFPLFKDVWTYIHDVVLQKYRRERNGLNVISGPIFDQNFDGNYDTPETPKPNEAPLPTHFFLILTSCRNASGPPEQCKVPLEAVSFVLPHRPDYTEACATGSDLLWVEDWMGFHVARVRDIELLSGLSFYQDQLSITDTLQLKTFLQGL